MICFGRGSLPASITIIVKSPKDDQIPNQSSLRFSSPFLPSYHLSLYVGYQLDQKPGYSGGFFRYNREAAQCGDKGLLRLLAFLPVDVVTKLVIDTRSAHSAHIISSASPSLLRGHPRLPCIRTSILCSKHISPDAVKKVLKSCTSLTRFNDFQPSATP